MPIFLMSKQILFIEIEKKCIFEIWRNFRWMEKRRNKSRKKGVHEGTRIRITRCTFQSSKLHSIIIARESFAIEFFIDVESKSMF